jgi:hypothetical protein
VRSKLLELTSAAKARALSVPPDQAAGLVEQDRSQSSREDDHDQGDVDVPSKVMDTDVTAVLDNRDDDGSGSDERCGDGPPEPEPVYAPSCRWKSLFPPEASLAR